MKVKVMLMHNFLKYFSYKRIIFLIPDSWWSSPELVNVTRCVIEDLDRCWRANRSCDLGLGAKDSSNQLVAGSDWSVPKNSGAIYSIVL